jgi:ABC-type sugar transport system substrate-binding protein
VAALVACREHAAPSPPPPQAEPPKRVAIALGEPIEGYEARLRDELRERHVDLLVESAHGHAAVQIEQVRRLLEAKPSALLLSPIVPDTLEQARTLAARAGTPLVALLRGDGRNGAWVGVPSSTLAKESGERAGERLIAAGIRRPRVVVVENPRWPETTRRVEATLKGIESRCDSIDLPLRLHPSGTPPEEVTALVGALDRLGTADLIVAGDRAGTATAIEAARASPLGAKLIVIGVTDDPAAIEAARASKSRLLLVAWKREDLVRESLAAIDEASDEASGGAAATRAIECELVGLGEDPPRKDGS